MNSWVFTSSSPVQTQRLGFRLGRFARPGLVVALVGDLGAGKTALVQGLARGLGVPSDVPVTSPTFNLVNPYEGRLTFYHLDLYRLGDLEELEILGFRDLLVSSGVTAVEWADRFPEALPKCFLRVELQYLGARRRNIVFTAVGDLGISHLLSDLASDYDKRRNTKIRICSLLWREHD